jgi:release factor glutamine methyltransferase
MSHLLGEAVLAEVCPGNRVLDMGTGCEINRILAARAGADVLALDINPEAVRAKRDNACRNGVADRLEVRLGDVFGVVDPAADGPFDIVLFDPTFRWSQRRDLLEMATADPDYRALTRFMDEARLHLSDCGRLLVFFGSSGDLGYLQRLIVEEGFLEPRCSPARRWWKTVGRLSTSPTVSRLGWRETVDNSVKAPRALALKVVC